MTELSLEQHTMELAIQLATLVILEMDRGNRIDPHIARQCGAWMRAFANRLDEQAGLAPSLIELGPLLNSAASLLSRRE